MKTRQHQTKEERNEAKRQTIAANIDLLHQINQPPKSTPAQREQAMQKINDLSQLKKIITLDQATNSDQATEYLIDKRIADNEDLQSLTASPDLIQTKVSQ